jgi:hypothetical protein
VPSSTWRAGNRVVVCRGACIVGQRARFARPERQTRLGAVERLDLLVERQHQAMRRRIEVEPDTGLELGGERGIARAFEGADAVRLQVMRPPDPLHRAQRDTCSRAIARPVEWVASPGGSLQVSATTWRTTASPRGALPGLRVASGRRPSTPAGRAAAASATSPAGQPRRAGRPPRRSAGRPMRG